MIDAGLTSPARSSGSWKCTVARTVASGAAVAELRKDCIENLGMDKLAAPAKVMSLPRGWLEVLSGAERGGAAGAGDGPTHARSSSTRPFVRSNMIYDTKEVAISEKKDEFAGNFYWVPSW
jgi:hypothetical protein